MDVRLSARLRAGFGRVIEYARPKDKNYKRLFCYEVSNVIDCKRLFEICGRYIHMKPDQMAEAMTIINRVLADVEKIDARNKAILVEIAKGRVQLHIAKEFGVSPQLVSYLKKGHQWGSVLRGHQARKLHSRFPRRQSQVFRLQEQEAA